MFKTVKKLFNDMLTEPDSDSFCVVRVTFLFSVMAMVGCTLYSIFNGNAFDAMSFGTGSSTLIASGGAGVGLKSKLGSDAPNPYIEQGDKDA